MVINDQLINQQRYDRELSKREGFKPWQCALMVWVVIAIFSTLIYWLG